MSELRNPTGVAFFGRDFLISGEGSFFIWSYTVPAGRRFTMESGEAITYILAEYDAASLGGGGFADSFIGYFPGGTAPGNPICYAFIEPTIRNVLGATARARMALSKEFQAGDLLFGQERDTNGAVVGGLSEHIVGMTGTEYDA